MAMRWYVVQVYSGFEDKVEAMLRENAERSGLADSFGQILVPREEVVELKEGQKVTSQRKFFPGYIMVEMDLNDETWHVVKDTRQVSGFLGSGGRPRPVTQAEVDRLIRQIEEGIERPKPKVLFEVGEPVRVIDGPFASFNGLVEEVDQDKGKLKVSVSIFGRPTPVELDYVQVEKG
ncbi:MAG: transcription termination/antitermination protein NusG [Zetaproteobacteria bacterium CG_4_9_14_3_um_filter_49_83]|nr:MAG: transcription termination/antitermination protein NusG [Zetaproteobacteria bacterium CG1_02_49_23]PIQ30778.1 MAG: transcription termination/antitermination protein NusG [Zetaproteobacteria bacterium CG17_big_fil_post_rev_8_21_14_2_50_50_13]PIV29467.1 MAG: transcription termination/antitermination protein NusG [Zetaproteobacteria bacterium CG02_land_8_20_14_3_00_50_9]PIY56705.1 MAG: transcription termination/antitermination protein NusG [Zetaproteobacteria bacterium CG_4_10_14_0_8_um_filt